MTLLYTDPFFLRHETGRGHPERPDATPVTARLAKSGTAGQCVQGHYKPLTEEEVAVLHPPAVVRLAQRAAEQGGTPRRGYSGQFGVLHGRAGGGRRLRVCGGRRDKGKGSERLVPGATARPSRHADAQHGFLSVQ